MNDIQEVYKVSKDLMDKEKMSACETNFTFYSIFANRTRDIRDMIEDENKFSNTINDELLKSAAPFIHNFWNSAKQNDDKDRVSYQEFEGAKSDGEKDELFNDIETCDDINDAYFNVLMV